MNEVVIEKSNPCIWKMTWETKYFMNKTVVMDIVTNLFCVCVVICFCFLFIMHFSHLLQPNCVMFSIKLSTSSLSFIKV